MNSKIQKRIITSIFLLSLLTLMFFYNFILIISLIIIGIISWIEFYALISKIFLKKDPKTIILKFFYKFVSLLYLSILIYLIIVPKINDQYFEIVVIYSILISVMSDIGGLIIGKTFKGKKLTKISPNKTISGSIGSFLFSLVLSTFFYQYFIKYDFVTFILFTLFISLASQVGDLLISLIKRKAKVKDTSDLLPGHGGFLDRIDGILIALPIGLFVFNI
ncbi:phosphatidate cytidylyltransferase [Pelagibacterales bacterium SAG-MED20]|nr:phosphatidate cytidylyltransferase [Pelagibacterales bacterium SAG-MED20]